MLDLLAYGAIGAAVVGAFALGHQTKDWKEQVEAKKQREASSRRTKDKDGGRISVTPIGTIHLMGETGGRIEIPLSLSDTLDGLETIDHVWVIFVNINLQPGPTSTTGAVASTPAMRPVGMSLCKLDSVERGEFSFLVHVKGTDLIDGAPVLEMHPYDNLPPDFVVDEDLNLSSTQRGALQSVAGSTEKESQETELLKVPKGQHGTEQEVYGESVQEKVEELPADSADSKQESPQDSAEEAKPEPSSISAEESHQELPPEAPEEAKTETETETETFVQQPVGAEEGQVSKEITRERLRASIGPSKEAEYDELAVLPTDEQDYGTLKTYWNKAASKRTPQGLTPEEEVARSLSVKKFTGLPSIFATTTKGDEDDGEEGDK